MREGGCETCRSRTRFPRVGGGGLAGEAVGRHAMPEAGATSWRRLGAGCVTGWRRWSLAILALLLVRTRARAVVTSQIQLWASHQRLAGSDH